MLLARSSHLPLLFLALLSAACDVHPAPSGNTAFPIDHTCDAEPSPSRFRALRIGQTRAEVVATLGTSLWFVMRSGAGDPAIEVRTTSPSGTNLTYMFLFVDGRLDCVLPCERDFMYELGDGLLDGGGQAEYLARIRADAEPLASIDFARVKPLDESSQRARDIALLYTVLTLHDGVGDIRREARAWQEITDSIQVGATGVSVRALLGNPVATVTSPGGDDYETFRPTRGHGYPITVAFRNEKVRAVFSRPPHRSLAPQ